MIVLKKFGLIEQKNTCCLFAIRDERAGGIGRGNFSNIPSMFHDFSYEIRNRVARAARKFFQIYHQFFMMFLLKFFV